MRKPAIIGMGVVVAALAGGGVWWWQTRPRPLPPPPEPPAGATLDVMVRQTIERALTGTRGAPDDPGLRRELAMVYHANGLETQAEEAYTHVATALPDDTKALYQLARLKAGAGQYRPALTLLNETIARDPSYAPLYWHRGFWQLELGELAAAKSSFGQAAQLAPSDPAPQVGLARVALLERNADEAIRRLEPLARGNAASGYVNRLLGNAYQLAGRLPEAGRAMRAATPDPPPWNDPWADEVSSRAVGYRTVFEAVDHLSAAGQVDTAVAQLEALRPYYPKRALIPAKIGEVLIEAGRYDAAERALLEAGRLDPESFMVQLHLANLFQKKGDLDRSLRHADRAIELHPTFPLGHRIRADVMILREDWPAAAASLREALRHGTRDIDVQVNLARILYTGGDRAGARQAVDAALDQDSTNVDGLVLRAIIAGESGDFQTAGRDLQRAQQLAPNDQSVRTAIQQVTRMQREGRGG